MSQLIIAMLAGIGAWISFAQASAAAEHAPNAPPAQSALSAVAEKILSAAMPSSYEQRKNWGQTKPVTVGVKVELDGGKLETRRRKKAVNDGQWQHYRVTRDQGEPISLSVTEAKMNDGRLDLRVSATARLHGFANVMQWNRGIRTYSVSADCDATVRLDLDCQVALQIGGGILAPNLSIDPKVTRTHVELVDFRLTRVGGVDGWLAKQIGRAVEDTLRDRLSRRDEKLADSLNRSIAKHRDELRVSADDFIKLQWTKAAAAIERQGAK